MHEPVDGELALDPLDGGIDARVVGGQEADERDEQVGGVEVRRLEGLHERSGRRVDASRFDLLTELGSDRTPASNRAGRRELAREADATVERDPGHHFGRDEVLGLAADLPNAVIGLVPALTDDLDDAAEKLPEGQADLTAVTVVEPGGVEQVAVGVELELGERGIADADRS